MKKSRGFTLIEVMIVIVIIGILTAVVLASLSTARAKSRDTKRISDISQLQLAIALYLNKYGKFPVAASNNNGANAALGGPLETALVGTDKFIAQMPTDPFNNTQNAVLYKYGYKTDFSGTTYCLGATLEKPSGSVDMTETCTALSGTDVSSNNYKVKK